MTYVTEEMNKEKNTFFKKWKKQQKCQNPWALAKNGIKKDIYSVSPPSTV